MSHSREACLRFIFVAAAIVALIINRSDARDLPSERPVRKSGPVSKNVPVHCKFTDNCRFDSSSFAMAMDTTIGIWNTHFQLEVLDKNIEPDTIRFENSTYMRSGVLFTLGEIEEIPGYHAKTFTVMGKYPEEKVLMPVAHRVVLSQEHARLAIDETSQSDRVLYYAGLMLHELGHAVLDIPDPTGCSHRGRLMGDPEIGKKLKRKDIIKGVKNRAYHQDLELLSLQWAESRRITQVCLHRIPKSAR